MLFIWTANAFYLDESKKLSFGKELTFQSVSVDQHEGAQKVQSDLGSTWYNKMILYLLK